MQKNSEKADHDHPVAGKLAFSLLIIAIYLLGKRIPIPWVLTDKKVLGETGLQHFIQSSLGSDMAQNSILSVGFMPYMTAMIIVSLGHAVSKENKSSSKWMMREIRLLTVLAALLQSILHAGKLTYVEDSLLSTHLLHFMTVVVLIGGSFVLVWLSERCARWGLGGSQVLILVNVLENFWKNGITAAEELYLTGEDSARWISIAVLAIILVAFMTIVMERTEIHIPICRVMIHNSFAGESNMAIKLNPVGTMPVMYVMTLFAIPYYLCEMFSYFWGEKRWIVAIERNLNLQSTGGIIFFLILLAVLTFLLARIYIDPRAVAEALQKSGDYIPGIHPGKATAKALENSVCFASCVSTLVTGGIIVLPLLPQVYFGWKLSVFMMPMSVMILTGLLMGILEEVHVVGVMNRYRNFSPEL